MWAIDQANWRLLLLSLGVTMTTACGIVPAPDPDVAGRAGILFIAPAVIAMWPADGGETGPGLPIGLARDQSGLLYVGHSGPNRIQTYDSTGRPGADWGSYGGSPGRFRFRHPTGVQGSDGSVILGGRLAVDALGHLYVADTLNARIQVFDSNGNLLMNWGGADQGGGLFLQPVGVAVDEQGAVYVADRGRHQILKLSSDGRLLLQWGGPGTGEGELHEPMALAVNRQGQVYVADSGNARIQVFDRTGQFLTAWGGWGTAEGRFGGEVFLAVDAQGRLYAADYWNHRVQVFTGDGAYLAQWGFPGVGVGAFSYPSGITVDEHGNIYVLDLIPGRIQTFRPRVPWPTAVHRPPTPGDATPSPGLATPAGWSGAVLDRNVDLAAPWPREVDPFRLTPTDR
jgi:DNA-binding beta-propeller fold protein YncE